MTHRRTLTVTTSLQREPAKDWQCIIHQTSGLHLWAGMPAWWLCGASCVFYLVQYYFHCLVMLNIFSFLIKVTVVLFSWPLTSIVKNIFQFVVCYMACKMMYNRFFLSRLYSYCSLTFSFPLCQCLMYLYHYPDIWYDYATWHAKSGSIDSAIKVFQRALKALPGIFFYFCLVTVFM